MKVGGKINKVFIPETYGEFVSLLKEIKEDYVVLGNGSNVIFQDHGFRGNIILNKTQKIQVSNTLVSCSSGTMLKDLVEKAKELGLSGLEFSAEIPGTVGGAIYMNAGAWGKEIKDSLNYVKIYDGKKEKIIFRKDLEFGFRKSSFHKNEDWIILQACFSLKRKSKEEIEEKLKSYHQKRIDTQPLLSEVPSSGTIFKKKLKQIREAKLGGTRIRGACVSTKNPGFIINDKNASSKDVLDLIDLMKMKIGGGELEVEIL